MLKNYGAVAKVRLFVLAGITVLIVALAGGCGESSTPSPAGIPGTGTPVSTPTPATTPVSTPTPATTPVSTPTPATEIDTFIYIAPEAGNEVFNPKNADADLFTYNLLHMTKLVGSAHDGSGFDVNNGVASRWDVSDGGKVFEFTIREGITFHNGEEITADDVVFSLNLAFDPEATSNSAARVIPRLVERPHTTGPNTVKIVFDQPLGFFLGNVSEVDWANTAGAIISKSYWESVGGENGFEDDPGPGTSGPFTLVRHKPGEELLYERFEDYFLIDERFHPFKKFSYEIVPELATRVAALQAGNADLIAGAFPIVEQITQGGGSVVYAPESHFLQIELTMCAAIPLDDDGLPNWCHDQRARAAIDYAIDRAQLQQLFGGPERLKLQGTATAASPRTIGYRDSINPVAQDPAMAQQLMADLGFPNGEGFNNGRPILLQTWEAGTRSVETATLLCVDIEEVLNIGCDVRVGEKTTIKDQRGEVAGLAIVRTNETAFDSGRNMFSRYSEGGRSYHPETEAAVLKAIAAVDEEAADTLFADAHKIANDARLEIYLGVLDTPYGLGERIADYEPWPISAGAFWTIKLK